MLDGTYFNQGPLFTGVSKQSPCKLAEVPAQTLGKATGLSEGLESRVEI